MEERNYTQENQEPKAGSTTHTETRTYRISVKQILIAAAVVAGIIVALLVWKTLQVNGLEKKSAEDIKAIKTQARTQLMESHMRHLRLVAKPYTWAVRSAMLQNNLSQVNDYANDIVKEKNVVSVMVVDTKNTVVSSTNKKYEGKDYVSFGTAYYLNVDSSAVNRVNDSLLVVASPIMGFNNKLGTLIFTYAVPPSSYSIDDE